MKYQGLVVLQSSHLVEDSCSVGRGRGRRLLDVVERADHVYDRSEQVARLVFGGSERLRAIVVEVSWRGWSGVSLVSRRRGFRFRRIGRSLLQLVVPVRRFQEPRALLWRYPGRISSARRGALRGGELRE